MRRTYCVGIVLVALLSTAWVIAVPFSRATLNWHPDEGSHLAVIRFEALYGRLPPYSAPYDTSVHPPLYHALGAVIWASVAPAFGSDAAVVAVRGLSLVCGLATVLLVGRGVGVLWGRSVGFLASLIVGLVPMRVSLSAAVNNDNLAAVAAAGVLAVLASGLRWGFPRRRVVALTLWCALGVGAKVTCLGLVPVALLGLVWSSRRRCDPIPAVRSTVGLVLSCVLLSGWWYVRNIALYGDPLRARAADRLWSGVQPGFSHLHTQTGVSVGRYLVSAVSLANDSFWGVFDAMSSALPVPVYYGLGLCLVLALVRALPRAYRGRARREWLVLVGMYAAFVVVVFALYNWKHYTPQGRYLFVLLSPFGAVFASGWLRLFPSASRRGASGALIASLVALNLFCLVRYPPW
jgi:4-amino-4-deoxy-L-arabinose transferase-like glycosyltransferase